MCTGQQTLLHASLRFKIRSGYLCNLYALFLSYYRQPLSAVSVPASGVAMGCASCAMHKGPAVGPVQRAPMLRPLSGSGSRIHFLLLDSEYSFRRFKNAKDYSMKCVTTN